MQAESDRWQVVAATVGRKVVSIFRVLFEYDGVVEYDDGEVQLGFDDGSTLRLGHAGGGDHLVPYATEWDEPAVGVGGDDLGRWVLVDHCDRQPYGLLVGESIAAATPLISQFGLLAGAQLRFNDICMNIIMQADECHVLWGCDEEVFSELGFARGKPSELA